MNLLKKNVLFFLIISSISDAKAQVDLDFYVYLCFGQSNMEGVAGLEVEDKDYVDPRFQMLACVDFSNPERKIGQWYTAYPPIVRQTSGLGMADYFGRTMVANLPENVKVGVVDIAIGGTKIEGFISEEVPGYIKNEADWLKKYFEAYGNDPYKHLVKMAKIAQETGVIKGILLHQGESNKGQSDWPLKVKLIYDRLMEDLGLNPEEVPLFVGETVCEAMGGICYQHNAIIDKIPTVIPNSYVISSAGCPQRGDGLHFTAQGYRIMGKRYARAALNAMNIDVNIDTVTVKSYEREYGENNPEFEFDVEGGTLDGTPEISCEATTTSPVGTYDIIIKRGTETNYNVTYVKGTLTITKAPLKIKAETYTRKQGEENPEFTLTYEGFKNNETEVVLTKKPTATTTATKESAVGDYTVTVSGAEATNYEITYVDGVLTVTAVLKGDTNDDGVVDEKDIVDIMNYSMGKSTSTGKFNEMAADMNEDGVMNPADIVQIANYILRK